MNRPLQAAQYLIRANPVRGCRGTLLLHHRLPGQFPI